MGGDYQNDRRYYGLDPLGQVYWGFWFIVIGAICTGPCVVLTSLVWDAYGPGAIIVLPIYVLPAMMLRYTMVLATPVFIDSEGIWIRSFFGRRFIGWQDVRMVRWDFSSYVVYYGEKTSPRGYLANFVYGSFHLVFGLNRRDELVGEIIRRSSRIQGKEIEVDGFTPRLF